MKKKFGGQFGGAMAPPGPAVGGKPQWTFWIVGTCEQGAHQGQMPPSLLNVDRPGCSDGAHK